MNVLVPRFEVCDGELKKPLACFASKPSIYMSWDLFSVFFCCCGCYLDGTGNHIAPECPMLPAFKYEEGFE